MAGCHFSMKFPMLLFLPGHSDTSSNHVFAIRGYWKSQDDFVVDFNTLTKINNYKIDFILKNAENQVTIKEETQAINDTVRVHFDGN